MTEIDLGTKENAITERDLDANFYFSCLIID